MSPVLKVTIFGSTGKVGRAFVAQALAAGHRVTAFSRSGEHEAGPASRFRVHQGDVLDGAAVTSAIDGSDVVVCTLGSPLRDNEGVRTLGTRNIVDAMQSQGVQRLVCLSALGAGDSRQMLPWYYRRLLIPLWMNRLYADHEAQEKIVRESALDWTLCRPAGFVEGEATRNYKHGFSSAAGLTLKISIGDVADFLVKQLTDVHYLGASPALSS